MSPKWQKNKVPSTNKWHYDDKGTAHLFTHPLIYYACHAVTGLALNPDHAGRRFLNWLRAELRKEPEFLP